MRFSAVIAAHPAPASARHAGHAISERKLLSSSTIRQFAVKQEIRDFLERARFLAISLDVVAAIHQARVWIDQQQICVSACDPRPARPGCSLLVSLVAIVVPPPGLARLSSTLSEQNGLKNPLA